tara:strand:- start:232 stop:378 length:147 start_codon:yes stop_codon:yes gene_type:complete
MSKKIGQMTVSGLKTISKIFLESDNQITFFVPNEEKVYTLSELTEILI